MQVVLCDECGREPKIDLGPPSVETIDSHPRPVRKYTLCAVCAGVRMDYLDARINEIARRVKLGLHLYVPHGTLWGQPR
jgi:hypothetical protein